MSDRPLILVIDDDTDFLALAEFMLTQQGCDSICVEGPDSVAGKDLANLNAILLDWQLGSLDGRDLIGPLRERFPGVPVVFVTAHSSPEVAAESIKLGAFDFLTKPLDPPKLMVTINQAVEHCNVIRRLRQLEQGTDEVGFEGLIGVSPQMQTVYSTIRNVAPTDVSVMICGESGTGKELVANAIHQQSDRARGNFVPINMASIPAELAESTLFGHEKGAFTGADKKQEGAAREAAGGTLFLDEMTEMPIELQSKLLRFLQERVFRPVGGNADLAADVRIVSATNRNPLNAVEEQRLREDLYYRLNVVPITLPPLRERDGDIALLATHTLQRFAKQYSKSFESIDAGAMQVLEQYDWPGNVRQLVHVIQRAVVLNDGDSLEDHMLPSELKVSTHSETHFQKPVRSPDVQPLSSVEPVTSEPVTSVPVAASTVSVRPALGEPESTEMDTIVPLETLEREAIANALRICNGSAYEAASRLGISAATIYRRIKLYGIDVKDIPDAG
ncbi:MAG: sigma-54 dependent transcriptional regulator [Planctomycetota bacterium]